MSYKTENENKMTYKEIMNNHCRDILGNSIYNESFDDIYKYYSECYLKKISKNTHYDDIIKKYENIIKMVKTYKDNSEKHYKDCLEWLKTNEASLEIVDSKTSESPRVDGVKPKKNGMDFYTEKLRKHFEASEENIVFGADPKNQKWLAKYHIGSQDGIQSFLLLEKVGDDWSSAQKKIIEKMKEAIEEVLYKPRSSEGTSIKLCDILRDECLGEPDSTITDVVDIVVDVDNNKQWINKQLSIHDAIEFNLNKIKKIIEVFESKL